MAGPLKNINVIDMGWLMVGPFSARYFADYGATVIKVENRQRRDPLRGMAAGSQMGYHFINCNKPSVSLDFKSDAGREALLRLVKWADVLVESFTPGVIDKLGFSYETLRGVNPRLVMLSTGLLGRKGTMGVGTSGTGTTGAAYSGANSLIGMPGRHPVGPYGPWTDGVAPRFTVSCMLAALHRRETTGQGEHIDLAQAEAGIQFILPAATEFAVNGVDPQATGDVFAKHRAPCAVFKSQGEDHWILIDASEDKHWRALQDVIGDALRKDEFSTLIGRLRNREALREVIANWTAERTAPEAEQELQSNGVPAHVVAQNQDLYDAPDLKGSEYFQMVDTPLQGEVELARGQFSLAEYAPIDRTPGPELGANSEDVLETYAGYSKDEIAVMKENGALS